MVLIYGDCPDALMFAGHYVMKRDCPKRVPLFEIAPDLQLSSIIQSNGHAMPDTVWTEVRPRVILIHG